MRITSLRHNADIWSGDRCQQRNLAGVIGTHLDHRGAMFAAQPQQSQRHTNVIIELALRREYRATRREPRCDRNSVWEGKSVAVRVDFGGRRIITKKKK